MLYNPSGRRFLCVFCPSIAGFWRILGQIMEISLYHGAVKPWCKQYCAVSPTDVVINHSQNMSKGQAPGEEWREYTRLRAARLLLTRMAEAGDEVVEEAEVPEIASDPHMGCIAAESW
jgi:hypothetical protein